MSRQASLFESERMVLDDATDLTPAARWGIALAIQHGIIVGLRAWEVEP